MPRHSLVSWSKDEDRGVTLVIVGTGHVGAIYLVGSLADDAAVVGCRAVSVAGARRSEQVVLTHQTETGRRAVGMPL